MNNEEMEVFGHYFDKAMKSGYSRQRAHNVAVYMVNEYRATKRQHERQRAQQSIFPPFMRQMGFR